MNRKFIGALALVAYVACSGDGGGTGNPVVTTVEVTITPASISVSGTAQATATPKDQKGNTMGNKSVTWATLTPNVATVSTAGIVTGVAPGTASIQATVAGVSGTGTVQVVAAVSACTSGATTVSLATGEVKTLTVESTQGCIKVPSASSAAADYLVIPSNLSTTYPDVSATFTFKSDEGETVPSANILRTNDDLKVSNTVSQTPDIGLAQILFENGLRANERKMLRLHDAQVSYQERRNPNGSLRYSAAIAVPAVGDRSTFKVPDASSDNLCTHFGTITAEVKYVNDKVIIYSDITSPLGGFTATDFQQIGDEFSSLIYPTDLAYFGTPLDQDKNGRIIILYTPEVNKLPGTSSSFVGGFFWAGDLFTPNKSYEEGGCPQSNFAEMFYVLTPDPQGVFGNIRSTTTVRQGTRGTIAHEFQHMINASERINSPVEQNFEQVWLDEALAHFAEDAVGRVVRGIGEAEDAGFQRTLGGNVEDFQAFFFQNFLRFREYLKTPSDSSPVSKMADESLAIRGAAWALLHYTADQYAPGGNIKAFTTSLVHGAAFANGDTGIVNLTKAAGNTPWETIATGFLVANYADNLGIAGLSPVYQYKVYDFRNVESSLPNSGGTYPLKVTTISGSSFAQTNLKDRSGAGANYFFISRPTGSAARTFRFLDEADPSKAASFTGATWILLRTR